MRGNNKIQLSLLLLLVSFTFTGYASNVRLEKLPAENHFSSQQNDPTEFLKGFFKWYRTMFEYLDHHVQYLDSRNRINFHETERYLSLLKSSGFFSVNYINHRRVYFKQLDLSLQQSTQNDGTTDKLSYDFMMHSQDTKRLFDDLDKITLLAVNTTPLNATVKVTTPFNDNSYLLYYLRRVDDKYIIDKIDFLIGGVAQE